MLFKNGFHMEYDAAEKEVTQNVQKLYILWKTINKTHETNQKKKRPTPSNRTAYRSRFFFTDGIALMRVTSLVALQWEHKL
jgi:hypothetical protein